MTIFDKLDQLHDRILDAAILYERSSQSSGRGNGSNTVRERCLRETMQVSKMRINQSFAILRVRMDESFNANGQSRVQESKQDHQVVALVACSIVRL